MAVANSDNLEVTVADGASFLMLLALAETGEWKVVPALRELVAESDSVCALMESDESLAERFDNVVAAWKDLAA